MKATIIYVSDNDKHFTEAIKEYTKRTSSYVTFKKVKPVKRWTQDEIIQKETDRVIDILSWLQWKVVMLSIWWAQLTTEQWADNHTMWEEIVYIIWWPYWLDESRLQEQVHSYISLGKQTMPHWLALLVLLEQLYRVWTIQVWKTYHY